MWCIWGIPAEVFNSKVWAVSCQESDDKCLQQQARQPDICDQSNSYSREVSLNVYNLYNKRDIAVK